MLTYLVKSETFFVEILTVVTVHLYIESLSLYYHKIITLNERIFKTSMSTEINTLKTY